MCTVYLWNQCVSYIVVINRTQDAARSLANNSIHNFNTKSSLLESIKVRCLYSIQYTVYSIHYTVYPTRINVQQDRQCPQSVKSVVP